MAPVPVGLEKAVVVGGLTKGWCHQPPLAPNPSLPSVPRDEQGWLWINASLTDPPAYLSDVILGHCPLSIWH